MKMIPISRGKFAMVSDEDYDYLVTIKWFVWNRGDAWYVMGKIKGKHVYMHRVIMNPPDDLEVDHINRNGLDNRRENLRLCTHSENNRNRRLLQSRNTTGYRGVERSGDKFRAQIILMNKRIYLGSFSTAEEAARVRDEAAKEYFGEFAVLNFP
jgi:hypothetical protein